MKHELFKNTPSLEKIQAQKTIFENCQIPIMFLSIVAIFSPSAFLENYAENLETVVAIYIISLLVIFLNERHLSQMFFKKTKLTHLVADLFKDQYKYQNNFETYPNFPKAKNIATTLIENPRLFENLSKENHFPDFPIDQKNLYFIKASVSLSKNNHIKSHITPSLVKKEIVLSLVQNKSQKKILHSLVFVVYFNQNPQKDKTENPIFDRIFEASKETALSSPEKESLDGLYAQALSKIMESVSKKDNTQDIGEVLTLHKKRERTGSLLDDLQKASLDSKEIEKITLFCEKQ